MFPAQQTVDGLRIGKIVEPLDERDWPTALFCGVIIPTIPTDGNTVVAGKPLFRAGGQQLLTLPEQELFQINFTGTVFLIVCKMNVWDYVSPLP